jgi:hypothetical protein
MSSDEKQQHDDHKIHIGLSTFNSRVVQTVVPVNKFTSLVEPIERLLSTANHQATRRASTSVISEQVGSNK